MAEPIARAPIGASTRYPIARFVLAGAGMAILLYANYFLRRRLERADNIIYSFLEVFYRDAERMLFAPGAPWYKLLLPIPEFSGAWTATTLILTHLIERELTPPVTWYVFNAALMVASFMTSWMVYRSLVFSFTLVICMGFGTQLYAGYGVAGGMGLYLLLIYYLMVLWCGVRVVQGAPKVWAWRSAFAFWIVVTALAYESWLDFAVFLWLAAAVLAAVAWRFRLREWRPGLTFGSAFLAVVCAAYLYIKMTLGYGQTVGAESDVLFNYPVLAPKIEDLFSNFVTQFYIVITNFLPPAFITSPTFYEYGADEIVKWQHGYHAPYHYLVVMQYLFFWRYLAGAALAVFGYVLFRCLRALWRDWSPDRLAVVLCLVMIAVGGPTHAFVKARPMNSTPLLAYHVLVGVMGAAFLLSLGARHAVRAWPPLRAGLAVAALWAMVFYGAIYRPAYLGHQAAQVGLGEGIYPDPRAELSIILERPFKAPGGSKLYRITPPPTPGSAAPAQPFKIEPMTLPTQMPPLNLWTAAAGVTVTRVDDRFRVSGNAVPGGYQISSPPIVLPSNRQLVLRVDGMMLKGKVCVGLLNEAQQWLLPPANTNGSLVVDTASTREAMFVFVNCQPPDATEPIEFEVTSVSYGFMSPGPR